MKQHTDGSFLAADPLPGSPRGQRGAAKRFTPMGKRRGWAFLELSFDYPPEARERIENALAAALDRETP